MTLEEIMLELEQYGDPQTKKTLMTHGAREPLFGVKVADLKKILKKTKKNHELSLELYNTGNSDAMYLAGLMADETKITKEQLESWVENAYWYYLSEFAVPWVASETPYGFELGRKWIASKVETIAAAGWATLADYAKINDDELLDMSIYHNMLDTIAQEIHTAPNRVRYTMNGFVITVGSVIISLTEKAKAVARQIGQVHVEMGGTACKVPLAEIYIQKVIDSKKLGKKRKTARC